MIRVDQLTMQLQAGGHVVSILKGLTFEVPQKQMVIAIEVSQITIEHHLFASD